MKRISNLLKLITALAMAVFLMPLNIIEVQAEYVSYDDIYPMACRAGQYEVSLLNDSGSFDKQLCTSNWSDAVNKMRQLGDGGVIRHSSSGSASKIINMNNGVVYSYPQRNGTNLAILNQFSSNVANMKQTYVTVHREMRWKGLETWSGDGHGNVHVVLTGFDGYTDLSNVDLVPMKAITDHIPMYLGGNDATAFEEEPFLTYPHQAYYRVEKNGNYTDLVYHCFTGWSTDGKEPQEWTFAIGPAPEWMKSGEVYYSDDGTTFYRDRYFSDQAGIYYPYYEFLPLRTKTGVRASSFDAFLDNRLNGTSSAMTNTGQLFVSNGETYGMNALLVYAIAILESGNGTSDFSRNRNNLFGIAAYDTNPNAAYSFPSVEQCIKEEMGIFLRGYTDINDYRFFGPHLGNKGSGINVKYAGDPYWGMKIAAIAYGIDKTDNNFSGELTDFNTASLGVIKDDARVNILKRAGGDVLYNSAYGATYQKNHMVTVLAETGGYYQIQSTSNLSDGSVRSVSKEGLFPYNWDDSGFLAKTQVLLVNTTAVKTAGDTPTGDYIQTVEASINEAGILSLSGEAYRPGIFVSDENTIRHTITIQDSAFQEVQTHVLTTKAETDAASFEGEIDLTSLDNGSYFLSFRTDYSKLSDYSETNLLNVKEESRILYNGKVYSLKAGESAGILSIDDVNCGTGASYDEASNSCVCLTGYENYTEGSGCAAKPDAEDAELYQMVDSISYPDEETLEITGYAFFRGRNASADSEITHAILLIDQESGEETVIEAETSTLDTPMNFADGYDYSKILYTGSIDLASLPEGNYALKVRVTNGETTSDTLLISNRIEDPEDRMINGVKVRVQARAMANYRLEISKERNDIHFEEINKPTRRNSVYAENSIDLTDNVLTIDGTAFLYGADMAKQDSPKYHILLVDETGRVSTYEAETYVSDSDPAKLLGLEQNLSSANFRFKADLSELKTGVYRMYLDITVGKNHDVFELYNIRRSERLTSEANEKEITLYAEKSHSRYVLSVLDKSLAH